MAIDLFFVVLAVATELHRCCGLYFSLFLSISLYWYRNGCQISRSTGFLREKVHWNVSPSVPAVRRSSWQQSSVYRSVIIAIAHLFIALSFKA